MGFVQNFAGLAATRLLLGIAEAGLFPGVTFLLTVFYPRHKTQFRIALFFSAATSAGSLSGILAYAIGFMNGVAGYNAWRWIFILYAVSLPITFQHYVDTFNLTDVPLSVTIVKELLLFCADSSPITRLLTLSHLLNS